MKNPYDIVIIGAGIIGLATGMKLLEKHPKIKIAIIDKDSEVSTQQSGHNSGVVHSGIYYKPGSFKAKFCVEGRTSMSTFCEENEIPTWACGKLIVAINEEDKIRLDDLYERGTANKVKGLRLVDKEEIKDIEPHVNSEKALYAPHTAIVDYRKVSKVYADKILSKGGDIILNTKLIGSKRKNNLTLLETNNIDIETKKVINCAGLHSDRIAKLMGDEPNVKIIPFRGEYYTLKKDREYLVKGLIYPTPDPAFPFLGVHLTQTMKGWVEAGPNAVLAMKREGYKKSDFSFHDMASSLFYSGFWKMALKSWKTGLWEWNRSLRKSVFLNSLQKLVPELISEDLDGSGSGVRAQAVDSNGKLIDDFHIVNKKDSIHVLNAPSPGATSSLVIGEYITKIAEKNFNI
mgnify:CR=1 FL=1|jgi:L-2-hydroxyglutarate oxidase